MNKLHIRVPNAFEYFLVGHGSLFIEQYQPGKILTALAHYGRQGKRPKELNPVLYPLVGRDANPGPGPVQTHIETCRNVVFKLPHSFDCVFSRF